MSAGDGRRPATSFGEKPARVYSNAGNPALLGLLDGARRVLDVGCGAGDNAALLRARDAGVRVVGITHNPAEAALASAHLERCHVFDIESPWPAEPLAELRAEGFDALVFSHVLEHLREPSQVLARFARLLVPGGSVLIAVPNVLGWRQRVRFLRGRFEYEASGVLDATHLRFFTYYTAAEYLLADCPELSLVARSVTGGVPLWLLRRRVLPARACEALDRLGCRAYPNLFGSEILLKAIKR
jgi:2-polyprenyl-3-methyl-5-hydroxy-6-metoxy-1,4-benzoquinol methylase